MVDIYPTIPRFPTFLFAAINANIVLDSHQYPVHTVIFDGSIPILHGISEIYDGSCR